MLSTSELPDFDKLWNYGDPAATESKFTELLPVAKQAGDTAYHAELLTQIARTHSLRGNFDTAHSILNDAEAMLTPETKRARVRYLLERGRTFNSSGAAEKALPLFLEASQLGEEIQAMRFAIDAVHMCAIAETNTRKKVEWNLKGIAMVQAHPEQKGWLWALYNNMGEDYLRLGEYENAWTTFHNLADFQRERMGNADVHTLKDEAKALRLWGRCEQALALLQPVLDAKLKEGEDNGWLREEIAESLFALGNSTEAKPHFVKAYELLSADDYCQKYEPEKLQRLQQMAA